MAKHSVSPEEVEECFADSERLVRRVGTAYFLIAKTEAGRFLEIGFLREKDDGVFVFHAMDVKDQQKRKYRKRGK